MTIQESLELHRDVATLKADVSSIKEDMSEVKSDVKTVREGLVEERVKLARFAVLWMGALYVLSKLADPLIAKVLN